MDSMLVTEDVISLVINGKPYSVNRSSPTYGQVEAGLRDRLSDEELVKLFTISGAVRRFSSGDFEVVGDTVQYKGEAVPKLVSDRLIHLMRDGMPYEFLKNFWTRLHNNVSLRVRNELYTFLEHKGMCITESGMVRAYKAVRNDWLDVRPLAA